MKSNKTSISLSPRHQYFSRRFWEPIFFIPSTGKFTKKKRIHDKESTMEQIERKKKIKQIKNETVELIHQL